MTRYQLLLLPALAGSIFLLGGALHQKPVAAKPLLEVDGQRPSDTQALELLTRAVAALAPEQVRWLECKIWQQGICEKFNYQACGRLLTAPADRCRFDLNVKVGNTVGALRLACDGKAYCQSLKMGDDKAVVTRLDLPGTKDKLKSTVDVAKARAQFLQEKACRGPGPTLRVLQQRLQGARCVQGRWNGRDVFVIAGAVAEDNAENLTMEFVPAKFKVRQSVVYLEAQSLWPVRVEWWGAEEPKQVSQLLLQREYRDPVLNQPLSAERCAAEFAVAN